MKRARWIGVVFALVWTGTMVVPLNAQTIDYSGLLPGDDIEGQLLGNVMITSPAGDVTYIVAGDETNKAYGAPNVTGFPANGCLPGEGGFSDFTTVRAEGSHHYVFTFFDDNAAPATVGSFQITMFDFGDYNPHRQTYHAVIATAYDVSDNPVTSSILDLYTTNPVNPRVGSYTGPNIDDFDPYVASDACTATEGQPGRYTFSVAAEGIAYVTLDVETASDPKIGFGAVQFELEEQTCDELEVALCAGQTNDIGTVNVTNDADFLYVTFSIAEEGWYLEETHVAVGSTVDDIPLTKKGNPIPGQFPYACELDPMQTSCTVKIELGDWCAGTEIVIAAHAAVVEIAGDGCETETFWANEVISSYQGSLSDGGDVSEERSDPGKSLGAPNSPQPQLNFYSLGFDLDSADPVTGWLNVGFGHPIYNGPGNDVVVQEVTWGTYPLERAEVFGVNDGTDYFAGIVTNTDGGTGFGSVDLPMGMTTFDSVKLLDATDPAIFRAPGDGYDVDAIGACYLFLGEETAWGDGCYGTRFVDKGNWGTYFTYTINRCADECP